MIAIIYRQSLCYNIFQNIESADKIMEIAKVL
jgi:hypothetical protein